jgi:6-pyruvoyltetrahydropterin/6-carboxytetrahydropterin synthase
MKLTARYRFAASHRLQLDQLSPEENRRLFDKCNNPHGHGHDYSLEVTVEGPVGADGQVVNRAQLDSFVHESVIAKLDHRNLNCDVDDFAGINPTTENLAELIGGWLQKDWALTPRLVKLGIIETPKNRFDWEAR